MKHDIIKTDNYLLIVSDEEIKVKDKVYWTDPEDGISSQINTALEIYEDLIFMSEPNASEIEAFPHEVKKIIAHLPLNNSLLLEGVDLLPPLEDESNFFAEQETIKNEWNSEKSFKAGYNKAEEKYKYTEDDLKKACIMYAQWITGGIPSLRIAQNPDERFEQIIQSLQQPKYPIGFECEMVDTSNVGVTLSYPLTKTTTNSQGQTVLVGTYIYK